MLCDMFSNGLCESLAHIFFDGVRPMLAIFTFVAVVVVCVCVLPGRASSQGNREGFDLLILFFVLEEPLLQY